MTNLYILDGNLINSMFDYCSDSVYRIFSEKPDLTKSNILCIKSKDAIPNDFLEEENMNIILDLINSLFPYQYNISITNNYRRSAIYKINKNISDKEISLRDLKDNKLEGHYVPVNRSIILPFGDRTVLYYSASNGLRTKSFDITNAIESSLYNIGDDDMLLHPAEVNIELTKNKETIFSNQITFKIEYLTVAKNYNCHSCWQLFNSVLRMIDNPFEQGILRTYINLVKNKEYKDINKFTLFGLACAFPDHGLNMIKTYNPNRFLPKQGTYGHLLCGSFELNGNYSFYYKNSKGAILPIFKEKIDIDEKYRKTWTSGNKLIFDNAFVSNDHTSSEQFTERSTATYLNIYNKNYSGIMTEFNIVDYNLPVTKDININNIYETIDKLIFEIQIYLGQKDPTGEIVECVKEIRDKGFFYNRKYFKISEMLFFNEFNFIETIPNSNNYFKK